MKALVMGVLVVILLIGGYLWFVKETPKDAQEAKRAVMESTPAPEAAEDKTVIGSIKEAMGLGTALRCTYAVGEGAQAVSSEVYVSGGKFKTSSLVNGVQMEAVFDGKTQYMWMSGSKEGMKMEMACLDQFKDALPAGVGTESPTPEDYQKSFDMAKNVSCEPALGVDFTIPATVQFTDQCALMEQMTKMMPKAYPGQ